MKRTDTLPAMQEIEEHQMINDATRANREVREQAVRSSHSACVIRIAADVALWIAMCGALVFLMAIGDLAGWLMYVGSAALSLALGIRIGREL